MRTRVMKIIGCQFDIAWEDKPANFARVRSLLETRRPLAGELVLLPEMFATGFSMNVAQIAEPEGGPTETFLRETARELQIDLLGGFVRREQGRGSNQAVCYDPQGRELARYRKLHPFTFGGESDHYAPGTQIVTFDWHGVRVSPFICYDLRFPEVFRAAMAQGAELLAVIANWPEAREAHWITLLRARAIENQAYVAGVNR